MPGYVVVEIEVLNADDYEQYKLMVPASLEPYGGRFIVRGGASEVLEGSWSPKRLVILEFPSVANAKTWWESPEYAVAKRLRQASANTNMIVIEGS